MQADKRIRAARAYYSAEEYTDAAFQYRAAKAYDDAVGVVRAHRAQIEPAVAEDIVSVVKLAYIKTDQLQ